MKVNKFVVAGIVAILLALVGLVGAQPSHAGVTPETVAAVKAQSSATPFMWNLAADFLVSPDQTNPNPDSYGNADTWSFMRSTTAHDASTYSLITQFYPDVVQIPGLQGWVGPEPTGFPNDGVPSFVMNTAGVTVVPNAIIPPSVFATHPDSSQPSIVGWHSPFTGAIAIAGGVTDLNSGCGDGILWYIDKNSLTVASGSYPDGGAQLFIDGTNGNQIGNVPVTKGDFIYFLVAPGGDYCADSTQLDVTITVVSISKPAPPTLVSPAHNATIPRAGVLLDWSDVPFATRYKVVVKDAAMNIVAKLTIFEASQVKVTLPRHQTYSWYVQACTSGGCSIKSATRKFEN